MANRCVIARHEMAQTQIASSPYALRAGVAATKWPSHKAETYPSAMLRAGRWGGRD